VLIADDCADMRAYLAQRLDDTYEVELAPDGAAALEAARARPPDLVLTDVMMPRLDGVGVVSALLSRPEAQRPRVVFVIAASFDFRNCFGGLPVRRVFPKPLDAVRLAEELTRALSACP
jgi:CheY-like chemotaxis protein